MSKATKDIKQSCWYYVRVWTAKTRGDLLWTQTDYIATGTCSLNVPADACVPIHVHSTY